MILQTSNISQAVADQIGNAMAANGSFTLTICQVGDLSHYAENPTLSADLPALFVQPIMNEVAGLGVGGEQFYQTLALRCVFVDSWTEDDENIVKKKVARTEEIIDKGIIRSSGNDYRLNDAIQGVVVESVLPKSIEYTPQEHLLVAQDSSGASRQLYATAFTIEVTIEATR